MRARPLVLYLCLVVIGVAAGFFMASRVMAGSAAPGSAADPLVSQSYVDEQVATYIAGLNQRISDMTAQEAQLEQTLAQVQGQQGTAPAKAAVSKQLYIKTGNSHVNLRKGPGTSYAVIGTATRGDPDSEPMTVLSQSGDWYQVRLPDARTAWVADWLVEER